jgi:hypothetical protein
MNQPVYQFPVGAAPVQQPVFGQPSQTQPTQAQGGGVFNSVSPLDIASKARNLGNISNTVFNPATAKAVDAFGHSTFGIGNIAQAPGPYLPGAAAPTGIADGLSTNFTPANAIGGFAGGFAANKVFGEGTGTSVGSTLGGIVGSFGGPLGSAAGAFIGGGIGSMFNSKPSNRLQVGGINFDTGEYDAAGSQRFSQQGEKYSPQNASLRDTYSSAASDTIKYLRSIGAEQTTALNSLVVKVGDRSGYSYFWEPKPQSQDTVDFRGAQVNKELFEMSDADKGQKDFGKDPAAFSDGLREDILGKFNLTPEQAEEARQVFDARAATSSGGENTQQGGRLQAAIPMVAGRKTFKEYVNQKKTTPEAPNASV